MSRFDGILNVNKPPGMTSHDVVNLVRRLAGQKRVGHAGTLDPSAEGVLLICVGKGTKVVEYLTNDRKAYRAEITLGESTDTYDAEGSVTKRASTEGITLASIERALGMFRGPITQVPPAYSAIKLAGKPLYKLARAGVEVSPQPRPVTIYALDLLDWQPPVLTIYVKCSKGTYIRSIANDLGAVLECGAHLSHLLRLASGRFTLASASTTEELVHAFAKDEASELIFALDEALLDYGALIVGRTRESAVRNGVPWAAGPATSSQVVGDRRPVRVYSVEGEIVAMAEFDSHAGRWQPSKVF
ncbi:MAG: tRNA pseudouridine(55) synthase TruB [Chloroflexi bacterium]|nr:tRNA pseudouridine(55) synthase TruB [Chloroflexota bacterium]